MYSVFSIRLMKRGMLAAIVELSQRSRMTSMPAF
jgi:hypothetical protein